MEMLELESNKIIYETNKAYLFRTGDYYSWKFWLPKSFCDTDNKMIVAKIPSYFNFIIFRGQKGNEIREQVSYEQILRMTVNNDYHSINNVLVHVPSKMEVVEVEVPNELKR